MPDLGREPTGTRAAEGGDVGAGTTFAEWLRTRPQAEQDEMLGKTKAAAWRRGEITLQQMLGRDLQPLSLAELREKDRL